MAAAVTVIVAMGFGLGINTLVGRSTSDSLHLRSVSTTQLDQMGLKLAAASPPPYCALSDTANERGWTRRGVAGCPISKKVAERNARTGGSATVQESALARATMLSDSNVGRDHLVWVVVVQSNFGVRSGTACPAAPAPAASAGVAPCFMPVHGVPRVVLLDAKSGSTIFGIPVGGRGILTLPRVHPAVSGGSSGATASPAPAP